MIRYWDNFSENPAAVLAPTVSACLSVGTCQHRQEEDPVNWANLLSPRPPLERPLQSRCLGAETTRDSPVIRRSSFVWSRAGRQGLLLTMRRIFENYWAVTARLNPSSPTTLPQLCLLQRGLNARVGADHRYWPRCIEHLAPTSSTRTDVSYLNCAFTMTYASSAPFRPPHHTTPAGNLETSEIHTVISAQLLHPYASRGKSRVTHAHLPESFLWHWPLVGCLFPRQIHRSKEKGHPAPTGIVCQCQTICVNTSQSPQRGSRWLSHRLHAMGSHSWRGLQGFYRLLWEESKKNGDRFATAIEEIDPATVTKGASLLKYKRMSHKFVNDYYHGFV